LPNPDHKTSPLLEPTAKGMKFEEQLGATLVDIVDSLLTDEDIEMCRRMSRDLSELRQLIENYQAGGKAPTRRE